MLWRAVASCHEGQAGVVRETLCRSTPIVWQGDTFATDFVLCPTPVRFHLVSATGYRVAMRYRARRCALYDLPKMVLAVDRRRAADAEFTLPPCAPGRRGSYRSNGASELHLGWPSLRLAFAVMRSAKMDKTRLTVALLWIIVATACVSGNDGTISTDNGAVLEAQRPLNEIDVNYPAYFSAPESGEATLVDAGTYAIEAAAESSLRLFSRDGREFLVAAITGVHGSDLGEPVAETNLVDNDEVHIILFLPDGSLLDAAGSYSGIVRRGGWSYRQRYSVRRLPLRARKQTPSLPPRTSAIQPARTTKRPSTQMLESLRKPDLIVSEAQLGCTLLGANPQSPGQLTRVVQSPCDTRHQVELRLTILNRGNLDGVLSGELWNSQSSLAQLRTVPGAQVQNTYVQALPRMVAGQSIPISPPPQSIPRSRTVTIQAGGSFTETVILVPAGGMPEGSHSLTIRIDPEGKLNERSEENNERIVRLDVAAAPPPPLPDHEWVICSRPSGVSVRVEPSLSSGKVFCRYWHRTRTELAGGTWMTSPSGRLYTACLRSNANYPADDQFTTRIYCSFSKTQEQLIHEAIEWRAPASNLRPVEFGSRTLSGATEPFNVCRVNFAGSLRIGRGWRGRCYFPFSNGNEVRLDSGFEYMVLSKEYGIPTPSYASNSIPLVLDRSVPQSAQSNFCRMTIFPDSVGRALTGNPLMLSLPGLLLPGNLCLSAAQGRAYVEVGRNFLLLTLE